MYQKHGFQTDQSKEWKNKCIESGLDGKFVCHLGLLLASEAT